MLLDGDEIAVGDRLFHLSAGYGTVETIAHNNVRVRMDSGGVLNMSENGYVGFRKLFFWYAPLMLMPRKGKQDLHEKAITVAQTVIDMLGEGKDG